jgi:hypothetical protein
MLESEESDLDNDLPLLGFRSSSSSLRLSRGEGDLEAGRRLRRGGEVREGEPI